MDTGRSSKAADVQGAARGQGASGGATRGAEVAGSKSAGGGFDPGRPFRPVRRRLSPRRTTLGCSAGVFPMGRLVTLSASEYRDQRTQLLLGNERCCPPNANPLGLSLMAFRPCPALAPDQEREHRHLARYGPAADSVRLLI